MPDTYLGAIITDMGENIATLQLEDGQTLRWPVDRLPAGSKVGDRLSLYSASPLAASHAILNELLDSGTSASDPS